MTFSRMYDISKGTLPITLVAGLVILVFSFGVMFAKIEGATVTTANEVAQVKTTLGQLSQQLQRLEQIVLKLPVDSFIRKQDFYHFCLGLERVNKDFRCPELSDPDKK